MPPDPTPSPPARPHGLWRAAVAGLANLVVAVGISRFSYTALVPALIGAGLLTAGEAGYIGAVNLVGYMVGAWFAAPIGRRFGIVASLHVTLVLTVLSLVALAPDFGVAWMFGWRLAAGLATGLMMVLGTSLVVAAAPPGYVGRVGGVVFIGPGLGIAISGVFVPLFLGLGIAEAWLGMAGLALLGSLVAWRGWPAEHPRPTPGDAPAVPIGTTPAAASHTPRAVIAAHVVSFFLFGIALMPHSIFWVDFVARGLGHGITIGGLFWAIAGGAALLGPMAYGLLAERIGFAAGLVLTNLILSVGLALPVYWTGFGALTASSVIFGSLVAGLASLMSGRCRELVPAGELPRLWGIMTVAVSAGQAVGGAFQAYLFEIADSYDPVFASGAIAQVIAALLCIPWFRGQR
jgi:MFS family permease